MSSAASQAWSWACSSPTSSPPRKEVLTEREEKASVAIASNEFFGGWTKAFTDPRLCAAIVDRLTFGGTILETGTDSYRLAKPQSSGQPGTRQARKRCRRNQHPRHRHVPGGLRTRQQAVSDETLLSRSRVAAGSQATARGRAAWRESADACSTRAAAITGYLRVTQSVLNPLPRRTGCRRCE
ncbi:ATP-binding protein [Kribbella sp. HUAS MG21]|uniref:ATP-binding protein n=1 Tax=Kribbella sp. HUAS MG21 TaxID=3160966 RepID=A0AAU7TQH9_9ACTN